MSAIKATAKAVTKRTTSERITPSMLVLERGVAFTGKLSTVESKYHSIFAKARPGDCIRCEPSETGPIRAAALKAVKNTATYPQLEGLVVRSQSKCREPKTGQVFGRVWLLTPI